MGENRPRGVPLSPTTMVDSVADWPLHQVVEHLRRKEKDDRPPTVFITCRSTIKSLSDVVRLVATRYNVSHNRICNWLSYQGVMIAREDTTVVRLASICNQLREAALAADDTDMLDMMNSFLPYSPRIQDGEFYRLSVYDWVASEFEDMAVSCGVPKSRMVQIYIAKSVLTDDMDIPGVAERLGKEIDRWDRWMKKRLRMLEALDGDVEE